MARLSEPFDGGFVWQTRATKKAKKKEKTRGLRNRGERGHSRERLRAIAKKGAKREEKKR